MTVKESSPGPGTRSSEDACVKITRLIRVFGMLPMNDRFQLDPRLQAASWLIMAALIVNSAYWMTTGEFQMEGLFHSILYQSRKVVETLTVIVITIQLFLKRERFRSIVYNLRTIECSLAEVGQRWSWSIHPQYFLQLPLLTILLILLPLVVLNNYRWIAMHAEICFIGVYVSHVCAFYDMLKHILIQIRTTEECTSHTKLYNLVESTSEDLNILNGIGIFMMVVSYFINLLHQIYQILNLDSMPSNRLIALWCYATYYGSFILWIIFTCSGLSFEANCFNNSLYNMAANKCENKNFNDIIFHFDMKRSLQFEANGFFFLNNSLICTMVITSTTYLVILLQWSPRITAVIT